MTKLEEKKYLESLGTEYSDLYNHMVDNGMDTYEATRMLKALPEKNERYMDRTLQVEVQMQYEVNWLEEHFGWSGLKQSWKGNTLWKLGMNTKAVPFYEEVRRVLVDTGKGHKLLMRSVVWGAERLDKEWVEKTYPIDGGLNTAHYASDAARDFYWNKKHGFSTKWL